MNKREEALKDVLLYTRLPSLPSEDYKGNLPWMKAIIETVKADCSESYCVAKTIDGESFRIIKDFGSTSPIVKYGKVYPYSMIREKYLPSANNREELVEYLASVYKEYSKEQIDAMSDDDIKKLVYREAVRITTENEKYETKMFMERKKYVDNVKLEEESTEESKDEEYLQKKDELINYQKKVKNETKKQRKTSKKSK